MKAIFPYLLLIACLCYNCTGNKRTVAGHKINKKAIQDMLEEAEQNNLRPWSYDTSRYQIYKKKNKIIKGAATPTLGLDKLKTGVLAGPFHNREDSISYFLKKTETIDEYQYRIRYMNVHQSFGLSDEYFQRELDQMRQLCKAGTLDFMELHNRYESDYRPKLGLAGESDWQKESQLDPALLDFMRVHPNGAIFQSEKVTTPQTTYLTLVQKVEEKKISSTIHYLVIALKE